jgi:guanylate kinase
MKSEIESGKFIEYAEVHGNYYGTSIDAVRSVQQKGQICILDIDVQGVRKVKETSLNPYYIFIAPPSMDDLEARLRGRGTEKEEDIQKRLSNAAGEMDYGGQMGNFDKYLVNGDLSKASAELSALMKTWYPHLSEATSEGGNAFVKQCASFVGHCIIS